jgi:hypothetical protein
MDEAFALGAGEAEYFPQSGLDSPNHVESVRQIGF